MKRADLLPSNSSVCDDQHVDIARMGTKAPYRERSMQIDSDEITPEQLREPGDEVENLPSHWSRAGAPAVAA